MTTAREVIEQEIKEHQGWSNYPTFLIWMHIYNSEAELASCRRLVEGLLRLGDGIEGVREGTWSIDAAVRFHAADQIKGMYSLEDQKINVPGCTSGVSFLVEDMTSWVMSLVNWEEIARKVIDKVKEV